LTAFLSLALTAMAAWLRRTVPLLMAWATLFLFGRLVARALVDGLSYTPQWRLIDLWNDLYLVGYSCLGNNMSPEERARQPDAYQAALVLAGLAGFCLVYLMQRMRGVEIVK